MERLKRHVDIDKLVVWEKSSKGATLRIRSSSSDDAMFTLAGLVTQGMSFFAHQPCSTMDEDS
jgi:hypothetical protein